jgi:hypothetical protein
MGILGTTLSEDCKICDFRYYYKHGNSEKIFKKFNIMQN